MDIQSSKRKISFSIPLITLFIIILFVSVLVQSTLIGAQVKEELKVTQQENFLLIIEAMTDAIELELRGNEHTLAGFAQTTALSQVIEQFLSSSDASRYQGEIKSDHRSGDEIYDEIINSMLEQNPYFDTIFMADTDGRVYSSNVKSIIGVDITGRDYFKKVIYEGLPVYTTQNALISKATGELTIVHAVPIMGGNEVMGLLGASLNLTRFGNEILLSKRIGQTGYPYVFDKEGQIIIHPNKDQIATKIQEVDPFFQTVMDSAELSQALSYKLNGSRKQGAFVKIPEMGWTVALAIDDEEAFRLNVGLRRLLFASNLVLIFVIGLSLFFYVRIKLIKKINSIENLMALAASGDLRERGDMNGSDEIASMSGYFNTLLDSFSQFFTQLAVSLQELEDVGTDLSSNMEETTAAVHQIKTNVENSLSQIEKQEESVSSTVSTVEEMTQNIRALDDTISRQSNQIIQGSAAVEQMIAQIKTVSSSTDEAERIMELLNKSSRTGQENLQSVSTMIEDIAEKSHELEQANTLIAGIAARTNLLAMNAAIEAAHAGEAGRGFAVVADEIRKLAEQSTTQSTQVKATIDYINNSITDVVQGSETSTSSFGHILKNMDLMGRVTGEIKASLSEQVAGSTQVLQTLEDLKDGGEEVSAGSKEMTDGNRLILDSIARLTQISNEVSQAIQEIGNGMDEINQAVSSVRDLTEKNRSSIDTVRTEADHYRYNKNEG
ncbi:MAG: methyl-accepting chemotaxis protein [Spirochaetales bacterium]|nr:methyl-accepting chemotaxis protein [Spirochaetales bacterium]